MKKDVIAAPLLPFTEDEEAALSARLNAMDSVALGHYADSARQSLGNKGLDASWRPRIQMGLEKAEAALHAISLLPPPVAEPVAEAAPAKAAKTAKAKAAKTAKSAKGAKAAEPEAATDAEASTDADTDADADKETEAEPEA